MLAQFAELGIADLRHFALALGANPGAALLAGAAFLVEEPHLSEEVASVEIADDHFAAVVILDQYGDRALDDEEQAFTAVARIDDGAFGGVATAVAMCEQLVEVLWFGCEGDSHARVPEI
ncbi:hypothetical protein D9M71_400130 [compost metagenome]